MIVYRITNKENGKSYIGITTKTIEARWAMHLNASDKGKCLHRPLYLAIKKYGADAFRMEMVCEAQTTDELRELEKHHISACGTFAPGGYNATLGGDGLTGYRHTEATKRRLGELNSKRVFTAEMRATWSAASTGRVMPREAVERARAKRIGGKRTLEQCARISAGRRAGKTPRKNKGNSQYQPQMIIDAVSRVRAGERQASVARDVGIDQGYLSQLLSGKRGFNIMGVRRGVTI